MARAPRVFTWSDGLHAYTVAATSKTKALAAWGVTRDLFKDGEAKEISAGKDVDAALASPGEVIKSSLAVEIPKGKSKKANQAPAAPPKPPRPSREEIARLHALERELTGLEREGESLETEIAARRARLEREAAERRADLAKRRKALEEDRSALRGKLDGG